MPKSFLLPPSYLEHYEIGGQSDSVMGQEDRRRVVI